jgi:nucleoside-diphosphate-sugar epimerase
MKILVSGSSGFIGGHVCERLTAAGHTVVPFDITLGNDMLDREQVDRAVADGIEVVYHIAAQADLTKIKSFDDAYQATRLNVEGTHNFADACAKHKAWMIYASTCCVYGNQEAHPEFEDSTLPKPSELYAATKLAGEEIIRGYAANFGLAYTILRFATIYGPGMRDALAVHIFFDQAYKGKDITVHGTGEQDRTQTFIDDLVDGIVATAQHPEAQGQTINLTADQSISAKKMAEDIKRLLGSPSEIVYITDRPNQTYHEHFSTEKAKAFLGGWTAKTSWEEGLKKTAEWLETSKGYQRP